MAWCAVYAPPDVEELVPMHRLTCSYELASLNLFEPERACDGNVLDFGLFRYHRAFSYVGATSSVLYFPLWKIWKSPYSFYLLGVALLGLFSIGLARTLEIDSRYALIPLGYFPFVYLFIHDTGPVRLALLSLPALALLARRALRDSRPSHQVAYGALAAALVVVCVEDKAFYLFVAPTILLCVIALVPARLSTPALVAFVAVAATGVCILLFVGHTGGVTYFSYLRELVSRPHTFDLQRKYVFEYTFFLPMYANRVFGWDRPLKLASYLCLVATGVVAWILWRTNAVDRRSAGWLAAAYGCGVVIALLTRVESQPHHYVFLHLPIVLLLMRAAGRSAVGSAAVPTYVMVSTLITTAILMWHPPPSWFKERARVFEYLSRPDVGRAHVLNVPWEAYSQQATYGDPAQLVTCIDPVGAGDARRLGALARGLSRTIIEACIDCSRSSVQSDFLGADVREIELGLTRWKVFEVLQASR